MSKLEAEMEFEIGDMVYMKDSVHEPGRLPQPFIVYERHLAECHGGVQRFYAINPGQPHVPGILLTKEMPPLCTDRYKATKVAMQRVEDELCAERKKSRDAQKANQEQASAT